MFERARDQARDTLGPHHLVTLGITLNLAQVQVRLGRLEQARAVLDQVMRLAAQAMDDDHPIVAQAYDVLGDLERAAGDLAAARAAYEQCLRRRLASFGPDHSGVAAVRRSVAALDERAPSGARDR